MTLAGAVLLLVLVSFPAAAGAAACEDWLATVVSVQGGVEVRRVRAADWAHTASGDRVCPGDTVRVHDRSRAALRLHNEAVLRLDQNTTMTFRVVSEEPPTRVDLVRGIAHFLSRIRRGLKVVTPFVNGTVEGTEFVFDVDADRAVLTVFEGRMAAETPDGQRETVRPGHALTARPGQRVEMRPVMPRDAVQWALHYPSILDARPPDVPADLVPSMEAYRKGDVAGAFAALERVRPAVPDAAFLTQHAVLLLSVGRVPEATAEIRQIPEGDGRRQAVESVIAVVQGDKAGALARAETAVKARPRSAAAWIARSYAQQASFDLEGARQSLEEAVKADPQNALAHARLAEVWLSLGRTRNARRAASEAVRLDPDLPRTQVVLGFVHLAELDPARAQAVFERAIALDPADPLARLGLGLARIRQGDVEGGRAEIETAASLDPGNALVRSYLGKAYYEERDEKAAAEEFTRAKALDPRDPTPWFYDAIAKQTANRPVEALQDIQRAIELNDNRAVYRSRLQLDADLAARSASLARIYSDLGFQQLALVEGWKSVNRDPTNFSAHRFLADSYAVLPRHEIARVSELLQSQLLQPLNVTPIQPRLAESNLRLLGAQGPAAIAFNEFNPLFNRDRLTLQLSGLAGSDQTYAGEAVLAGIYGRASFSLGGLHFQTDGWRANAYQEDRIANAFFQLELTPWTSVQGEFRYRKTEEGDLQLNFFPEDVRPNLRQETETSVYRFGARHTLAPDSILLASFTYQHRDSGLFDRFDDVFVGLSDRFPGQEAFSGELQYLFTSPRVNVTAGAGHFHVNKRHELRQEFDFTLFGLGPFTITTVTDEDDRHTNAYVYSHVNVIPSVTFTLGGSADIFDSESRDTGSRTQVNPKVGVTWNLLPQTTLRAAVFRTLKRTLITDQTLEPTQVAGFNQFFDGLNATDAWRYGVAVDQKFSSTLFGGAELSARELSVPFRSIVLDEFGDVVEDRVRRGDGDEALGRAYLFWTPHPWLALSAQYQYERFRNDRPVAFFFRKVTTHRLPIGVRWFHPSGVSAMARATYVDQHGDFRPGGALTFRSGRDAFWVVDTALSYRFPKRYGIASIGVTNLFDERFRYQETDLRNASLIPSRGVFARLTLELP